jgi:hypothetical protein
LDISFEYLVDIWGATLGDYHDQVQCDCDRHDCDRPAADLPKDGDERRQERDE